MKSDREFLDGIYEKAEIYEEQQITKQSTFRKGYNSLNPIYLAAAIVLMITSGVFIYQKPWSSNENSISPIEQPINEHEPQMVRGLPYSMDTENTETIIEGEIVAFSKEKMIVYVMLDHVYVGMVEEKQELKIVLSEDQNSEDVFAKEERVLLYLKQTEEGNWNLSQGISSKYSLIKEEGTVRYYQNSEGVQIDTLVFQ